MYDVIIVEDDPMVASINKQYIYEDKDFQVKAIFHNGSDALEYIKENNISLAILDVYMPKMNGLELLHKIRENNISVSVIMVTAANDSSSVDEALKLGTVDYLIKPFTSSRFQQALDNFKNRQNIFKGISSFNQQNIDSLIGKNTKNNLTDCPKGIQQKTLDTICEFIRKNSPKEMTSEEIADNIGLSRVTIRRYMNYLIETGTISERMNYETGGRPCMLYRWNS